LKRVQDAVSQLASAGGSIGGPSRPRPFLATGVFIFRRGLLPQPGLPMTITEAKWARLRALAAARLPGMNYYFRRATRFAIDSET